MDVLLVGGPLGGSKVKWPYGAFVQVLPDYDQLKAPVKYVPDEKPEMVRTYTYSKKDIAGALAYYVG